MQEAFSGDRSLLGDPDYVQFLFEFAKDFASFSNSEANDPALPSSMYPNQSSPKPSPWFLGYLSQVSNPNLNLSIFKGLHALQRHIIKKLQTATSRILSEAFPIPNLL